MRLHSIYKISPLAIATHHICGIIKHLPMLPNNPYSIEFLDYLPKGRLPDKHTLSTGSRVLFPKVIYLIPVSLPLSAISGAQTEDWTPGLVEFFKNPIPIFECSRVVPKVVKRELPEDVCIRY